MFMARGGSSLAAGARQEAPRRGAAERDRGDQEGEAANAGWKMPWSTPVTNEAANGGPATAVERQASDFLLDGARLGIRRTGSRSGCRPHYTFSMHPSTVHEQFAARAAADPGAAAVRGGGREATFGEVAQRAAAVAGRLRGLGVGPEALVAVVLDRSPDLAAALLGILAAGGAYRALDPASPPGRLAQQLASCRPAAVVTRRALARRLPPRRPPVLWLDEVAADGAPAAAETGDGTALPGAVAGAGNLACALTVAGEALLLLTHANLVDLFAALDAAGGNGAAGGWREAPGGAGGDGGAAGADPADTATLKMLWSLCRGAGVTVAPAGTSPSGAGGPAAAPGGAARGLDFGLFYFGNHAAGLAADHYRLVLEGARFADRHGFRAIWTPERHFHEFGGLFPNPAVLGAAIATATERLQIRAGSVVLPLHDPLRVAEEWSLVDNLSAGRAGVSFASGWHANDFVLKPGAYADRHEIMRRGIETVRRLWRGEALRLPGGSGAEVEVRIYPRPVQAELPVWVTAAGSPETFRLAGELGASVLTHLLGQEAGDIAAKIAVYRQAWRDAGHGPGGGWVTVMLHTYVAPRLAAVHEAVRQPLSAYLKTSFGLLRSLAASVGLESDPRQLGAAELDLLVARAYDRYVTSGAGLIGTPESCAATLGRLRAIGVDEVACLIDFGVAADRVLASLPHLDELRRGTQGPAEPLAAPAAGPGHLADTARRAAGTATPAAPAGGTPAGPAWPGAEVHLLDPAQRPVPEGERGEVCIGGSGVGRGYLGRADLTAARFLPDPWSAEPGARLYRTGGFARRSPGGAGGPAA
jgi:natural product biosynthesis luciferase-like monooxygenase protein